MIKTDKDKLFERMGLINPDRKVLNEEISNDEDFLKSESALKEGGWNLPDDVRDDDPHFKGEEEPPEESEPPEVKTPEFNLFGGIENTNDYLYTVYERVPNSEFGNVLIPAFEYAINRNSKEIEYRKDPKYNGQKWGRDDKGIFGADFEDEDIPRIKQALSKHTNVNGVADFIQAMDTVSGKMKAYEDFDGDIYVPDGEPDHDDHDTGGDNSWMDYINEKKVISTTKKLLFERMHKVAGMPKKQKLTENTQVLNERNWVEKIDISIPWQQYEQDENFDYFKKNILILLENFVMKMEGKMDDDVLMELSTNVIDEFQASDDVEDLDFALAELYEWADEYDVWIERMEATPMSLNEKMVERINKI